MDTDLTIDELLTTTRSVRRKLDLDRPVERAVIEECITIAQQAPVASHDEIWSFVVVTEQAKKDAIAEIYRQGWSGYNKTRTPVEDATLASRQRDRLVDSASYLAKNMHRVPAMVIPCFGRRPDAESTAWQSGVWGSIGPATWNFMLAARSRGLGTVWTSLHLIDEEAAAAVLGIPYPDVMQAALVPVGYMTQSKFKRAPRRPLSEVLHWEGWQGS
jgi:nitroreductase